MNMINKVFMDELDKCVIVFINDILVFSKIAKEHEEHLRIMLGKLRQQQLYAKFSKCEFWMEEVAVRHGYSWVPTDQVHGRDKWVWPTRRPADLSVGPIDLVGGPHNLLKTFLKIP
jgi:hypothetical protein